MRWKPEIADAHWPAADRRDADKTYNPMTISALAAFAPAVPVGRTISRQRAFRATRLRQANATSIVAEKSAFPKLAAIFAATPVSRCGAII